MNRHHVQAIAITALMVCICAGALSFFKDGERAPLFTPVVQLAGTIAGGVVGNAMKTMGRRRKKRRDLIGRVDRATLPTPDKQA